MGLRNGIKRHYKIISLGSEQDEMVTNQALADKKREIYLRRQSVCTVYTLCKIMCLFVTVFV